MDIAALTDTGLQESPLVPRWVNPTRPTIDNRFMELHATRSA